MGSLFSFIGDFFEIDSDSYTIESKTYAGSHFRALYKKTAKKQTIESVLKGLTQLENDEFAQFFTKYSMKEDKDDDHDEKCLQIDTLSASDAAVKCWTLQRPKFYGALKGVLLTDNKTELGKWMPFIRALNSKLVCQNPPKMKCYRGSKMSLQDFDVFKAGYVYRIPYYVAMSEDKKVAKSWPKSSYFVQFNIPKGCPNAASVSKLSVFPLEKEVLLPPYTAVRVVSKSADTMVVDVLDNLTAPKDAVANVMKVNTQQLSTEHTLWNILSPNPMYGGLAGTGAIGGMAVVGTACLGTVAAGQVEDNEENKFVD